MIKRNLPDVPLRFPGPRAVYQEQNGNEQTGKAWVLMEVWTWRWLVLIDDPFHFLSNIDKITILLPLSFKPQIGIAHAPSKFAGYIQFTNGKERRHVTCVVGGSVSEWNPVLPRAMGFRTRRFTTALACLAANALSC